MLDFKRSFEIIQLPRKKKTLHLRLMGRENYIDKNKKFKREKNRELEKIFKQKKTFEAQEKFDR